MSFTGHEFPFFWFACMLYFSFSCREQLIISDTYTVLYFLAPQEKRRDNMLGKAHVLTMIFVVVVVVVVVVDDDDI